jgi:hypothetical protein
VKKLALLALLLATPAAAQLAGPSPRSGSFQLQLTGYRPNIDAEFNGSAAPYQKIFGTSRSMIFQLQAARSLFTDYGTLDLGAGIGWSSKTGKGLRLDGTPSSDNTSLRILPLSLNLTYRMDWFVDHGGFPLVPYLRASLERWQWWVTNGTGSTAKTLTDNKSGSGATNGWSGALGVAFLLDVLDPSMAREMDRDLGINHTYLFFEFTRIKVDDFGSSKSWDLSNDKSLTWSAGMLFAF